MSHKRQEKNQQNQKYKDESFWSSGSDQEKKSQSSQGGRKTQRKNKEQESLILKDIKEGQLSKSSIAENKSDITLNQKDEEEIQADKKNDDSSWIQEEQNTEEKSKRGNRERGNRNERKNNFNNNYKNNNYNQNNNFKKKQYFEKAQVKNYQNNQNNQNNRGKPNYQNRWDDQKPQEQKYQYNRPYHSNSYEEQEKRPEPPKQKKQNSLKPRGQKCWPQTSIYIMETKLSITYRHISEHAADVLVIPYRDLTMNIYPGSIINKCKIDYRKKISSKSDLKQVGSIYVQKCVGIDNFKTLAFMKVGKTQEQLQLCVKELLRKIQRLEIVLATVLIPYSLNLGEPDPIFKGIVSVLEEGTKFTDICLSTNKAADFKEGTQSLNRFVGKFIQANEICIDY